MISKQEIKEKQQQLNNDQLAEASLYHRVFVQNPDGAELLAKWIGAHVFGDSCAYDASLTELAMKEGKRQFLTAITTKISLAEQPHD